MLPSSAVTIAEGIAEAGSERGEKRFPSKLVMALPVRIRRAPLSPVAREVMPPEGNPSIEE
jgi:hypothetical protein